MSRVSTLKPHRAKSRQAPAGSRHNGAKNRNTVDEKTMKTARQLREILMEHLVTLTPEEREERIKAGQKVMKGSSL